MPDALSRLVDLASARNGGFVESVSDDFFAPKERLILPEEPVFKPGLYTENGKWMDGWESRRKRTPGNDWCIVRLGYRGVIRGLDIDTRYFVGNYAPEASVDFFDGGLESGSEHRWSPLLERVSLRPDTSNVFEVEGQACCTHLRLNIFPDGGIARLRAYGNVVPDWSHVTPSTIVELSSLQYGGLPVGCSDEHFGNMTNLSRSDNPVDMGDGWETRRRRSPGHDWVIIKLGGAGLLDRVVVDTTHFKGNYPDRCSLDACLVSDPVETPIDAVWTPVLSETKIEPDRPHLYEVLPAKGPFSHVRLNIFPDGGVARLRIFGRRLGSSVGADARFS